MRPQAGATRCRWRGHGGPAIAGDVVSIGSRSKNATGYVDDAVYQATVGLVGGHRNIGPAGPCVGRGVIDVSGV